MPHDPTPKLLLDHKTGEEFAFVPLMGGQYASVPYEEYDRLMLDHDVDPYWLLVDGHVVAPVKGHPGDLFAVAPFISAPEEWSELVYKDGCCRNLDPSNLLWAI